MTPGVTAKRAIKWADFIQRSHICQTAALIMVLVDILKEVSFEEQYGSEFEWKC